MRDEIRTTRDRLFGLWAARELGLDGGNALVYAAEITDADSQHGERGMIAKVITDFARERMPMDADTAERQLQACENRARRGE